MKSSHRRNLYFWRISLPDAAGHDYGFMSSRYVASVARTNALLGQVLTAVRSSSTLLAATSVILTSDHGGRGSSHRDATKVYNYRVPLYTWGRGTSDGARLYAKNPDRYDPGTSRIGYAGPQPIRNMDVANTSLRLLNLPALADATPCAAHALAPTPDLARVVDGRGPVRPLLSVHNPDLDAVRRPQQPVEERRQQRLAEV